MTMTRLVRAELTKIGTQRSVWVAMGVVLAIQVFAGWQALSLYAGAVARMTPDGIVEVFTGQPQAANQAMIENLVSSSLEMSMFLPVVAALLAGQEFQHRQLRTSLLAVPARGHLVAAKLASATVFLLVPVLLVVATSTTFTYLAIKDWNPGLLLEPAALRGQVGFVGYALALCLVTAAVTMLARSTVVAIVTVVVLTVISMAQVLPAAVDALLPVSAGRNLLLDPVSATDLTGGATLAAVVLVGWVVITAASAAVSIARRDAP
ncbi:hypothetical protein Xcel_0097 [Xylanimonas cellulosilytica DSM 15894]|uniref:Uncharacterized protein n=1 Tax=Xylanimonas cellulosilytica (strain DSM 15894 / JCM 12276 / CECT 5975 / KCTC 9989 / LMG 20990 / NBRC 107835 / XIL07) TaxID=446471 RepID=D1BTX4_XYLCX|nr:ABC transporter permease [Xylanimonas cellulosilytica]ACZ29138.1 hypothetical protein Xcel_0097 [Xylanimonas cellulosilytica DSM 15894]